MAHRALIQRWLPRLETIFLLEVALMQHRVFGSAEHLPSGVPVAQRRFNQSCAALFVQLADFIDGKRTRIAPALDVPLRDLTLALDEPAHDPNGIAMAHGIEKTAMTISKELSDLARDISNSKLHLS